MPEQIAPKQLTQLRTCTLLPRYPFCSHASSSLFNLTPCTAEGSTQERPASWLQTSHAGWTLLQVQTARDKLQGKHPSDVLLAELAPKYSSTAHWIALQVRCPMLLYLTFSFPSIGHAAGIPTDYGALTILSKPH